MHFDTTLNLVWLVLGLLAFLGTTHATFRYSGVETRRSRWLHIVGVALIVAALFPYISATDDVLSIEHFQAQHDSQHPTKQHQNDNLIRLYETLDTPLVCAYCEVELTFLFVALVFTPVKRLIEGIAPFRAGRSPPFFATV